MGKHTNSHLFPPQFIEHSLISPPFFLLHRFLTSHFFRTYACSPAPLPAASPLLLTSCHLASWAIMEHPITHPSPYAYSTFIHSCQSFSLFKFFYYLYLLLKKILTRNHRTRTSKFQKHKYTFFVCLTLAHKTN